MTPSAPPTRNRTQLTLNVNGLYWLVLIVGVAAAVILVAWYWDPLKAWYTSMALLAGSILVAGFLLTGLPLGALIDERNKVSLSRLQAIGWTVIILSAFIVIAVQNIDQNKSEPLSVEIPQELLIVMGISATSLVASPLVKSTKLSAKADPVEATSNLRAEGVIGDSDKVVADSGNLVLETTPEVVLAKGQIAMNPSPKDARLADLVRGEETSNAAKLDLGKVQMLYFTLILALAYGAALNNMLDGGGPFDKFPVLDESMLALLGISHAAYLTNKGIPRTKAPAA